MHSHCFISVERNVFSHILDCPHWFISYRHLFLVLHELKPGTFDNRSPPPAFQEGQRGFAWAEDTELRANVFEEDKGTAATMSLGTKGESEIRLSPLFSCSSSKESNNANPRKHVLG